MNKEERRRYDRAYNRKYPYIRAHRVSREQLRELSKETGYPMTELVRVAIQRLYSQGFDESGMLFTDDYQAAYEQSRQPNGKPIIRTCLSLYREAV